MMHTGLATLLVLTSLVGQKPQSMGVFVDRAGARHAWSVSNALSLVWDGQVYAPVGGRFVPRSLAEDATEANWTADVKDLATLKAAGVMDLLIDPVRPATRVPAAAWQRVIDQLEADGFRYGIALGAGIDAPLSGTLVNPSAFRIGGVQEAMDLAWDIPGADSGYYVVLDAKDATLVYSEGRVRARGGQMVVDAGPRAAEGGVAVLYPHMNLGAAGGGHMPDLWAGFDSYRDGVLAVLGQVKFGPGMRFVLDPLGGRLQLTRDVEHFVPDSPAFRLEWEAFLSRKYSGPDALCTAWALVERDLKDHRSAASLVPLWYAGKGIPFFLDPETGKRLQVSGSESRFWSDLKDFRAEWLTFAMAATADLVKREIADVPVVFTHTGSDRVFTNSARQGGFDGLGAVAVGEGPALTTSGADAAYSQVGDSARSLWFLVTSTHPAGRTYASREDMIRDLDWLRSMGARGVFVSSLRSAGRDDGAGVDLIADPDRLAWLKDFGTRFAQSVGGAAGGPRILPFPAAASGYVQAGPIGSTGIWWAPSLAKGRALDFGSSYAGYAITLPDGEDIVIWSLRGRRETRLAAKDPRKVQAFSAAGVPEAVRAEPKNGVVRLILSEEPTIIRSGGQEVFPVEAVEEAIAQLKSLVNDALAAKLPAQDYKYRLDTAQARYRHRDMATAFGLCSAALTAIVELMQPYTWREIEFAELQTFTEVVPTPGASGAMYLSLSTSANPPREGYSFQIKFSVPVEDTYDVWIACSPPDAAISPFVWLIDTNQSRPSSEGTPTGPVYAAGRFQWALLGKERLKPGAHTFTLRVTDRTQESAAYTLAADALLITRAPFTPRGTARPPAVTVK